MVVLVAVFTAVLLVSFAIIGILTRQTHSERAVQLRVGDIQMARQSDKERKQNEERILKMDVTGPFLWLDTAVGNFAFTNSFKTLALQAGSTWTLGAFIVYCAGAGCAIFIAGLVFFPAVLLDAVLAMAGSYAPYLYLKYRRSSRLQAFNNSLPDAIDLMARALRAGHSLSSAIEVLSEQGGEAVAVEFSAVYRQQNFGLPIRDALLQMAERVPSKDLRFLVTAMLVQKETGGNLTEILDRATYVIRERLRIEGEIRTRTAQGRLTGWILSLLPVLMLFLLNIVDPEYARILLHDPTGQKLLYLGAALIAIGSFFINKIVNIQV
ncbi:MAG: type II secretion system F family protein [Acidobacteriaceae bacterium]